MNAFSAHLPTLLAALLALAVALAWVRLARWRRNAPPDARGAAWRIALLFALQPACAALLYFTLLPPRQAATSGTLLVLTAQADRAAIPAALQGQPRIALPEAPATMEGERTPDLATALRRHPDAARLHVLGVGLEARDAEAARGHALAFSPVPLPRGVVALSPVPPAAPGGAFAVAGRVEGVPRVTAELLDPAGQRIDAATADAQGRFRLTGVARLPGPAGFAVRVRDARRGEIETVPLPVWIQARPAPRVWALAGGANAEWKYLRRWATDAGIDLRLQVGLGGGLQLGDPPLPVNAATLRGFDLVVLDERSAAALGRAQRAALVDAVRGGLGVLLRAEAPVPADVARLTGFALSGGGGETAFRLPAPAPDDDAWRARRGAGTADAPVDAEAVEAGLPALARRDLRMQAADALPLLRDAQGAAVAMWRGEGRGRIGVWPATDTFRLVLAGHGDRHAALWSQAVGTLARPAGEAPPVLPADARAGERASLCGVPADARVVAPDGRGRRLLPDPATGSARCAAYWPDVPGWHRLDAGGAPWPFPVRGRDEAPGLRAQALRERTLALAATPADVSSDAPHAEGARGPSWPWFLAWLAAAGLLWWLERSRLGRTTAPSVTEPRAG